MYQEIRNSQSLPRVYTACSAAQRQRRVRNKEMTLIWFTIFLHQRGTAQEEKRKNASKNSCISSSLVICSYSDRPDAHTQPQPLNPFLIVLLISLSRVGKPCKSWGCKKPEKESEMSEPQPSAAAPSTASVALCIFKRIQAIWSLFIVLRMTHNGNLACDETT